MKITLNTLKNLFLFEGLDDSKLLEIEKSLSYSIVEYSSGEDIYSPSEFKQEIGFILDGECVVERTKKDGRMPLNTLKKYASFGVLAAFSCDEVFPTSVRAKKNSHVLFISKDEIVLLIQNYPQISMNLINFMSERISFLNNKIATFSSDNVEQKLSNHLLNLIKATDSNELSLNLKRTSEQINSGRASLYRAIDSLVEKGLIKLENKKIYIIDRDGLERNSK